MYAIVLADSLDLMESLKNSMPRYTATIYLENKLENICRHSKMKTKRLSRDNFQSTLKRASLLKM